MITSVRETGAIGVRKNPHFSVASPLNEQRIKICCAILSKRITGPIFINDIITGLMHGELLEHEFDPKEDRLNTRRPRWIMQAGAHLHRTADV